MLLHGKWLIVRIAVYGRRDLNLVADRSFLRLVVVHRRPVNLRDLNVPDLRRNRRSRGAFISIG